MIKINNFMNQAVTENIVHVYIRKKPYILVTRYKTWLVLLQRSTRTYSNICSTLESLSKMLLRRDFKIVHVHMKKAVTNMTTLVYPPPVLLLAATRHLLLLGLVW